MQIRVRDYYLTDGSMVSDVILEHQGNRIRLHAISYNDAKELCAKMADAIEAHASELVDSDH